VITHIPQRFQCGRLFAGFCRQSLHP
jgi:hypothetical protein